MRHLGMPIIHSRWQLQLAVWHYFPTAVSDIDIYPTLNTGSVHRFRASSITYSSSSERGHNNKEHNLLDHNHNPIEGRQHCFFFLLLSSPRIFLFLCNH